MTTTTERKALRRARVWVLGIGLVGFLSGAALGWAGDRVIATWWPADSSEGNAEMLEILAQKYHLTREQQRQIRMVLKARDLRMLEEYRKNALNLPVPLRSEIMSLRRHADERIYAVLTEKQREQYLEDRRFESPK